MKCRICGNERANKVYKVREMMFGYGDIFLYFLCSKCECLQIRTIPSDMTKYYADRYYSYRPVSSRKALKKYVWNLINRYSIFQRGIIGSLLLARNPNYALRILSFVSVGKDARILDVGCGSGALLYSLRELGFKGTMGIDPFIDKNIEYKNGLRILKKELSSVTGKWDLVIFKHSLEHIEDQIGVLETVRQLLKPTGLCAISIPIVSSDAWEHYGVNWVQLDAPRHYYLHSMKSMKLLAAKAGLEVRKTVYDSSSFQFWGSEQYMKGISLYSERSYEMNPEKSMFSKNQILAFEKRAVSLNKAERGDSATFLLS